MKKFAFSSILIVVIGSALAVLNAQQETDERAQSLPSHAECSLFGPSGPELQMSGLAAEARNRYLRSRLTQEVVSRLGSAPQADAVTLQVEAASNPGLIDQYLFGAMNANNVTPAPPSNVT